MIYLPQTFCLCHELKTGGITIGWSGVVFYVLMCGNWITSIEIDQESLISGSIGMMLAVVINGLLIYGSKEGNWMYVVPWLLLTPIPVSLALLAVIRTTAMLRFASEINNSLFQQDFVHSIYIYIAILSGYICVMIYCWLCVLSLLQQIKGDEPIEEKNVEISLKQSDEDENPLMFTIPITEK